jgi:hypothetical protein
MKRRWVEEEDWGTGDGHSRRVLGDRGVVGAPSEHAGSGWKGPETLGQQWPTCHQQWAECPPWIKGEWPWLSQRPRACHGGETGGGGQWNADRRVENGRGNTGQLTGKEGSKQRALRAVSTVVRVGRIAQHNRK